MDNEETYFKKIPNTKIKHTIKKTIKEKSKSKRRSSKSSPSSEKIVNKSNISQHHHQIFIKKIPKNINEYQHLLAIGNKEDSVRWMINLRQPLPELKKPSGFKEPSFYQKGLDQYSSRVNQSKNKDIADPLNVNVGPLDHLFRFRPGEKATNSQLSFETSLRKIKSKGVNEFNQTKQKDKSNSLIESGEFSNNPKRKLINSMSFYSSQYHMTNKPSYFSTVFPRLISNGNPNEKSPEPICKLYNVEISKVGLYKDEIIKKTYKVADYSSLIQGEHYTLFNDRTVDKNLGNRSQLFESLSTIGEKPKINWASSLRPDDKGFKSFHFKM